MQKPYRLFLVCVLSDFILHPSKVECFRFARLGLQLGRKTALNFRDQLKEVKKKEYSVDLD